MFNPTQAVAQVRRLLAQINLTVDAVIRVKESVIVVEVNCEGVNDARAKVSRIARLRHHNVFGAMQRYVYEVAGCGSLVVSNVNGSAAVAIEFVRFDATPFLDVTPRQLQVCAKSAGLDETDLAELVYKEYLTEPERMSMIQRMRSFGYESANTFDPDWIELNK